MTDDLHPDTAEVTYREPDKAFDPVAASDDELVANGLPKRPADPKMRKYYEEEILRNFHNLKYIEAKFEIVKSRHGRRAHLSVDNSTFTSATWSGGIVFPASGTFQSIIGSFVVPTVQAGGPTDQDYYCATWIGIDGFSINSIGSDDVCQAGVETNFISGAQQTTPWYEWYPYLQSNIANFPVSAGDTIFISIVTTGNGATTATLLFVDVTTNQYVHFTFPAPNNVSLVGDCAEWIVEAPQVNGSQTQLADYGEVSFLGTAVTSGSDYPASGGDVINMVIPNTNQVISQATLVSGGGVECQYVGST